MDSKKTSFITKFMLGFLGLSIVIPVVMGAKNSYIATTSFLAYDFKELIKTRTLDEVQLIDLTVSSGLVTSITTFIISCFIAYLYFTGKKLFIPIFILNGIHISLLNFNTNLVDNYFLSENNFTTASRSLVYTTFWSSYLLLSKQIKMYFTYDLKFKRKKYIKISEEEYHSLKHGQINNTD